MVRCPVVRKDSGISHYPTSRRDLVIRPSGEVTSGLYGFQITRSPDHQITRSSDHPIPMFIRHREAVQFSGTLPCMTSQTLASTLEGFLSGSNNAVVIEDGAVMFDLGQ